MHLTVREVMEIGYFKVSQLLVGEKGLDRKVFNLTIMDIPSITNWLKEGDLLISGVHLEKIFSKKFIEDLLQIGCAGIITKEKFIMSLDRDLIQSCNTLGLPIIIVPDHCSWGDMMNPIYSAIIRKQYKSIEDTDRFHNLLLQAFLKQNSLPKLSQDIIKGIGGSLAITTSNLTIIAGTGELAWEQYIHDWRRQLVHSKDLIAKTNEGYPVEGIIIESRKLETLGKKVFAYPIKESEDLFGYLFILKDIGTTIISEMEIVKIQFSGLLFSLKVSQQRELENSNQYYNSIILNEILTAPNIGTDDISRFSAALGKITVESYHILILSMQPQQKMDFKVDAVFLQKLEKELLAKNKQFELLLIFEYKQNIVIFIPTLPHENYRIMVDEIIQTIQSFEEVETLDLHIGIGRSHSFSDSKVGYQEAIQALRFSQLNNNRKCCYYQDLGLVRFLTDNQGKLNTTFINELMNQYIIPLEKYDRQMGSQLLETLSSYFANGLSNSKTHKALFIHKNTLHARLRTIEKILDCSLSGENLLHLQLAFKVRDYL